MGHNPNYCGCCGRPTSNYIWCDDCKAHIADHHRDFHERTYFAQHGKDCPYQLPGLPR